MRENMKAKPNKWVEKTESRYDGVAKGYNCYNYRTTDLGAKPKKSYSTKPLRCTFNSTLDGIRLW